MLWLAFVIDVRANRDVGCLQSTRSLAVYEPEDVARCIFKVAEHLGVCGTRRNARRLKALVQAARTKVTFVCLPGRRTDVAGLVGTCGDTRPTSDTEIAIDSNDAVCILVGRAGRTSWYARGTVAMVALRHVERCSQLRERANHTRLADPGSSNAVGHVPLGLARDRAGLAAYAALLIDDHRVACHVLAPLPVVAEYAHEVNSHARASHNRVYRNSGHKLRV